VSSFITEVEKEYWKKYNQDIQDYLLFGKLVRMKEQEKNTRKLAKAKIGKYEQTVFIDTMNNKAYKINDNLEPGDEIEDFEFIRWARPMDI
tara:strand:- start:2082 stop:2354 length:273 start_codon:yes stop_codon:yes gene_type:complete